MTRMALIGLAVVVATAAPADARMRSFRPEGAWSVFPTAISDKGAVTGTFQAHDLAYRGFVRDRSGEIAVFDPEGSLETTPTGINNAGTVVGTYKTQGGGESGFLRRRSGEISVLGGYPAAISNAGTIVGAVGVHERMRGFSIARDGTKVVFAVPHKRGTFAVDVNDTGTIVGYYLLAHLRPHGFLRAPDGTLTLFDVPDATFTRPMQVNADGVVTGYFLGAIEGCFVRLPDGTITTFGMPGATRSLCHGTDALGNTYGWYTDGDGNVHGLVRHMNGDAETFDMRDASDTTTEAVNEGGVVTGEFDVPGHNLRGFVGAP